MFFCQIPWLPETLRGMKGLVRKESGESLEKILECMAGRTGADER